VTRSTSPATVPLVWRNSRTYSTTAGTARTPISVRPSTRMQAGSRMPTTCICSSYGSNPDLGAPFHQDASWFPHADHLHLFLAGKVIGLFSDNPFTVGAIYFFLGFPLAALSMYWLARQRHLGRLGSVVAGVLFSVLPGHQTMFPHLWLASYWVVPLGMWLVLRAALGEPLFRLKVAWLDPVERRSALPLNLTTVFCVSCIALGGIYYSAFTLLLLAVTLVVRLVATRNRRSVAGASGMLAAIGALSLTAVLSVAASQDKSTLVTMPAQRGPGESEKYAGKLMDLILPWIHHRVDALQNLTVDYNSHTSRTLEEPALGVIALAGVVALLVIMLSTLVPQRVRPANPELGVLGVLTLVAISFFSIGGLGSFAAMFVTAQIRSWSRLFVIIALFGLLAVGYWVTVVGRRNRTLGVLTATALIAIGVLDQTNPALAPSYQVMRPEVADLTAFSQRIEANVGRGCSCSSSRSCRSRRLTMHTSGRIWCRPPCAGATEPSREPASQTGSSRCRRSRQPQCWTI